ncbi:MAG: zinc-binding dehydrogenase [Deltaproteobacteria bacterium]|nr:zinc-binding dehydrogenase [Deltaproteobacteria bacterium]
MRAAVMREKRIVAETVPDPVPGPGEVLVKTLACGICGSDLHALQHADQMMASARESGAPFVPNLLGDVVMGHEFCAEILDFGPNTTQRLPAGTRVVSMPLVFHGARLQAVGYSDEVPGGYGERMVLSEALLLEVPNGLATEHAATTEPMAVGVHAVAKANVSARDVPLVVGCGPVGLAVIAGLRLQGIETIVAADFSPRRRALAAHFGASHVVDPAERPAVEAWREAAGAKTAVLFECVGVPGLIDSIMRDAPPQSRIVVAGVCMERDTFRPMLGINKELNIQFVLGYTPEEFARTLRALSEGQIQVEPMITGRTGVEGVAEAFTTLGNPEAHAKILVEPWR